MKFSVITVVYNAKEKIEETIKSVLMQNEVGLEYIIIDGGSNDGTLDIIKKYENDISFWISEPDSGIYNAMNKGINYATGDVISFLNAGDIYYAGILRKVKNEIVGYDIVASQTRYLKNGVPKGLFRYDPNGFEYDMPCCHQAMFARKGIFSTVGIFDENYKISADFDWIQRVLSNPAIRVKWLNDIMVGYDDSGISSSNHLNRLCDYNRIIFSRIGKVSDKQLVLENMKRQYWLTVYNQLIDSEGEAVVQVLTSIYPDLGNNLVLYGMGYWGEKIIDLFCKKQLPIKKIVDSDENKWGDLIGNMTISSPKDILSDEIILVTLESANINVRDSIQQKGIDNNNIIFLSDLLQIVHMTKI